MSDRPLITMTLIAKDEAENINRCFDSWWEHVDEVVLVDTGSTDETVHEAQAYAKLKGERQKLKIGYFEWADDFARARQAADDLATGEWVCWCDLDDTIRGMGELRRMAAEASPDLAAFFTRYSYGQDSVGSTVSELWRERLVRNDGTPWTGRLHEHKLITKGGIVQVDPRQVEWIHHRDHAVRTGPRNLRILEAWLEDEPGNARVIQSIAMEYMGDDKHQKAVEMFQRYLEFMSEEPDRRAQAFRHMSVQMMLLNRPHDARNAALRAVSENWMWPDSHMTLAEAAHTLGRPAEAITHCKTVLDIGKPSTLLIINPQQYTVQPQAVMAVCLAQLGQLEDSMRLTEEVLSVAPDYAVAQMHLPMVRSMLRKERAAQSLLATCDVLVESGKLEKARRLLDQAPWYVIDDRRLVAKRGQLFVAIRQRLAGPAELAADEQADEMVKAAIEEAA